MQQKEGMGSRRFFPPQILKMFNFLNYFNLFGSDPSILAYRWDNVDYVPGEDPEMGGSANSRYKRVIDKTNKFTSNITASLVFSPHLFLRVSFIDFLFYLHKSNVGGDAVPILLFACTSPFYKSLFFL